MDATPVRPDPGTLAALLAEPAGAEHVSAWLADPSLAGDGELVWAAGQRVLDFASPVGWRVALPLVVAWPRPGDSLRSLERVVRSLVVLARSEDPAPRGGRDLAAHQRLLALAGVAADPRAPWAHTVEVHPSLRLLTAVYGELPRFEPESLELRVASLPWATSPRKVATTLPTLEVAAGEARDVVRAAGARHAAARGVHALPVVRLLLGAVEPSRRRLGLCLLAAVGNATGWPETPRQLLTGLRTDGDRAVRDAAHRVFVRPEGPPG